jgi:hypothetical protein
MEIHPGVKTPLYVLGFELWWQGFPVPAADARRYLRRVIDRGSPDLQPTGNPGEDVEAVMKPLEERRLRDPTYDFLRERVGGNSTIAFQGMYALLLLMLGGEPVLESSGEYADADDAGEPHPGDTLTQLLGLDRAQRDVPPNAEPLIDEDFNLQKHLHEFVVPELTIPGALSAVVEGLSDEELAMARDDAHLYTVELPVAAAAVQHAWGHDFAGFGIFTIERGEQSERWLRAATVPVGVLLRQTVGNASIDEFKLTLRREERAAQTYNSVMERFPEYAEFLKPGNDELLRTAPPELVAKMRSDITDFINSTPGLEPPNTDSN